MDDKNDSPRNQGTARYDKLRDLLLRAIPFAEAKLKSALRNRRLAKTEWWREFHGSFAAETEILLTSLKTAAHESAASQLTAEELSQKIAYLREVLYSAADCVKHRIKKTKSGVPSPQNQAFILWQEMMIELETDAE